MTKTPGQIAYEQFQLNERNGIPSELEWGNRAAWEHRCWESAAQAVRAQCTEELRASATELEICLVEAATYAVKELGRLFFTAKKLQDAITRATETKP